jgi:hypothetical protein
MPTIAFNMQRQKGGNLCWAAVASSLSQWRNPAAPFSQCQLAQDLLRNLPAGANCCTDIGPCDQDFALGTALQFCHVTIGILLPRALRVEEIQEEIDANKVICVGISWTGGGMHYVVIVGYERDAVNTLHIRDPHHDPLDVPYQIFVNSYLNLGKWDETFKLM